MRQRHAQMKGARGGRSDRLNPGGRGDTGMRAFVRFKNKLVSWSVTNVHTERLEVYNLWIYTKWAHPPGQEIEPSSTPRNPFLCPISVTTASEVTPFLTSLIDLCHLFLNCAHMEPLICILWCWLLSMSSPMARSVHVIIRSLFYSFSWLYSISWCGYTTVYPFCYWWIFGLLPVGGYNE